MGAVNANTDMIYKVQWFGKGGVEKSHGYFATSDAKCVEATDNMKWAIGKHFESILNWTIGKRISIRFYSEYTTLENLK
mgnify:CR=1 FL=1